MIVISALSYGFLCTSICVSSFSIFGFTFFSFFFSSRRRHTRSLCDWSSDVCSSDLDVEFFVEDLAVRSDREIFNEEINIACIADDTGFDSVWTIEHHFTPYTMVTNPLQYLTYIAGITKRVDLGTMVVVLPWHNPVRVAEDINMLDSFLGSSREIICGVGRGLGRREYGGMGVDQNEGLG